MRWRRQVGRETFTHSAFCPICSCRTVFVIDTNSRAMGMQIKARGLCCSEEHTSEYMDRVNRMNVEAFNILNKNRLSPRLISGSNQFFANLLNNLAINGMLSDEVRLVESMRDSGEL